MNKEKKESILKRVQEFFSSNDIPAEVVESKEETKEKFEEVLLVDGETMVTVEPAVEVGAAIVITAEDGTPVAAPAGEYELQDGRVLIVEEDGVVAAINEPSEEMPEEDMGNDVPDKKAQVKREIERIEKEKIFSKEEKEELEKTIKFLQDENDAIKTQFGELKKFTEEVFNELLAEPTKEPVVKSKDPFQEFKSKDSLVDAWMEKNLND